MMDEITQVVVTNNHYLCGKIGLVVKHSDEIVLSYFEGVPELITLLPRQYRTYEGFDRDLFEAYEDWKTRDTMDNIPF